jgi:hypothetical protein
MVAPRGVHALWACGLCGLLILSASICLAADRYKHLSADEIRTLFPERTITDEVHWSYHFKTEGVLDAMDLGEAKHGVWRLSGNELCLDFKQKRKVVSDCYEVLKSGNKLRFRRDGVQIFEGLLQDN